MGSKTSAPVMLSEAKHLIPKPVRNISLLVKKIGVFLAQIAPRFFGD